LWWLGLVRKDALESRVNKVIKFLTTKGYVERNGRFWFVTAAGNTALQDIERVIKKQRIDR
jgi:hypothetical protein